MFRSTAIMLVILRLAIGWHFLFEGLDKVRSRAIGPTQTNRPFSSAAYFREATGPLGNCMRSIVGDPYEETRALCTVPPLPEGPLEKPYTIVPPLLARQWDDYASRFVIFYGLDDEQRKLVAARLQQAKSKLGTWLTANDKKGPFANDKDREEKGVVKVKKSFPSGVVEVEQTLPERVAEYNALLDYVRHTEPRKLWLFGKDVENVRLIKAKTELAQKRSALMSELAEKTAEMKKSLAELLTSDQRSEGARKTAERNHKTVDELPADLQKRGEVPEPSGNRLLFWLDELTAYGLTVMGACLVVGLLCRINCVLLAGFLLMTYLAIPPFPWLPVPPNTEGNYFYVNKNLIEMLALLTLATTHSGRWLGIDALLHRLFVRNPKRLTPTRTIAVNSMKIAPANSLN